MARKSQEDLSDRYTPDEDNAPQRLESMQNFRGQIGQLLPLHCQNARDQQIATARSSLAGRGICGVAIPQQSPQAACESNDLRLRHSTGSTLSDRSKSDRWICLTRRGQRTIVADNLRPRSSSQRTYLQCVRSAASGAQSAQRGRWAGWPVVCHGEKQTERTILQPGCSPHATGSRRLDSYETVARTPSAM
jgi:hypothetical protein